MTNLNLGQDAAKKEKEKTADDIVAKSYSLY